MVSSVQQMLKKRAGLVVHDATWWCAAVNLPVPAAVSEHPATPVQFSVAQR